MLAYQSHQGASFLEYSHVCIATSETCSPYKIPAENPSIQGYLHGYRLQVLPIEIMQL